MKIGLTGSKGFLGKYLAERNGYIPLDCDVTSINEIEDELKRVKPDVVLHAAAKTGVDWCETYKSLALLHNKVGTQNLVFSCIKKKIPVVYLSTDHVFAGNKLIANGYREKDIPSPVNSYGASKWGAELAGWAIAGGYGRMFSVIRSSKVFDKNMIETGIEKRVSEINETGKTEIPGFIYRSYHYIEYFLQDINTYFEKMFQFQGNGIVHLSSKNVMSEYDLWLLILTKYGNIQPEVINKRFKELKDLAPRPKKCGLLSVKLGRHTNLKSTEDGLNALFNSK